MCLYVVLKLHMTDMMDRGTSPLPALIATRWPCHPLRWISVSIAITLVLSHWTPAMPLAWRSGVAALSIDAKKVPILLLQPIGNTRQLRCILQLQLNVSTFSRGQRVTYLARMDNTPVIPRLVPKLVEIRPIVVRSLLEIRGKRNLGLACRQSHVFGR